MSLNYNIPFTRIEEGDRLYIIAKASAGTKYIDLRYTMQLLDGSIVDSYEIIKVTNGYTGSTFTTFLPAGFMLSMAFRSVNFNTFSNVAYITAVLLEPSGGTNSIKYRFISDYIHPLAGTNWPNPTQIKNLTPYYSFNDPEQSSPGAGNNFTYNQPNGINSLVTSITFQLVCDATVANRYIYLMNQNGSEQPIFYVNIPDAITASQTVKFRLSIGMVYNYANSIMQFPLPQHFWLQNSGVLTIGVTNIQAADALSQIYVLTEDYIEGS